MRFVLGAVVGAMLWAQAGWGQAAAQAGAAGAVVHESEAGGSRPQAGGGQAAAGSGAGVRANSQMVVVDVVVRDAAGHPVRGLTAGDFRVTEDGVAQTVRDVEAHTGAVPGQGAGVGAGQAAELPELPPGVYTDYTPVAGDGALNVLVLDALNTPGKDRAFVRTQLREYVETAEAGRRMAIFGLANHLILLQGFTSDPGMLRDVVEHKLIPRGSSGLEEPASGAAGGEMVGRVDPSVGPGMAEMAANLELFEAEQASLQVPLRAQYTLDAFNTLAHYLAAFPGRKNLIWVAGSFPISLLPDGGRKDPFGGQQPIDEQELRETAELLTKAQVAVYPVDARGLMRSGVLGASAAGAKSPGTELEPGPGAGQRAAMERMAEATGGEALYAADGLAEAVAEAIRAGSAYYTLRYAPAEARHDGRYRTIRVTLTRPEAGGVQLAYRRGYDDEAAGDAGVEAGRVAYARAAMSRGAPMPADVVYKVRVLPASEGTVGTVAEGNTLDQLTPAKPPFRDYDVDFAALAGTVTLRPDGEGRWVGEVAFLVDVFDRGGRLLNSAGRGYRLRLTEEAYRQMLSGSIECHMVVSVPERTESFLRMGVEDLPANRFGVVEVPVSAVSHLRPAVMPSTPGGVVGGGGAARGTRPR